MWETLKTFSLRMKCASRVIASLLAALGLFLFVFSASHKARVVDPPKVLILGPTVTGGASSREAVAAAALGFAVEVVDNAGWAAKTQADFASYRALILGDPTCVGPGTGSISAAIANKATWGPVINGNVIIIGTDPVYHNSQGGSQLTSGGVKFATDQIGKTGMYITLSCYYHDTAPMTPIPLLDAFSPGGFTARGVGCFNDAHIVATHPSLTGITDATLSNWFCSVHEGFDKWPVDFQVLAIARNIGSSFTATDGSVGTPYILARGVTVISDIKLTPLDAENPVGTSHTVTATVTTDTPTAGTPVVGTTVTFSVISGPNTGATGTGVTDSSGVATFTYTSNGTEGTDFIKATFVDSAGRTQTSNTVTKKWVKPSNNPPVAKCKSVIVSAGASCLAAASIDDGSFDPDGDSITVSQSPPGPYPLGTTNVTLTVTDSKGASSACTANVTVLDTERPDISCPVGTTAIAGANCQAAVPNVLPGVTASDICDNSLTLSQSPAAGTLLGLGTHTITVMATDDAGNSSSCTTTFTVTNDPPVITSVTGPTGPLSLGASSTVTANFTDTGSQAHTVTFSWDDGSPNTTVSLASGVSTGSAAHVYSGAGVYTVTATVTDVCGASATSIYEFIVVYDPGAGFVTGGGWINSPIGAYTADPSLTGKANFGFVSKYQRGATVPTGQTEFQFKAGDLNFHSSSYEWLVVAGCKAQYKGAGMINGVPGYEFLLTAYDAQAGPGGSCSGQNVDRFRIKITGPGGVVYDNNPGGSGDIDSSNPQAIGGGSIVVHNK